MIAAARQDRTFLPPADQCPLDPSAPGRPTEIPADSYDVVVFENRFPSLSEPLGRCEVVCFTPAHDSSFAQLSPRRVRTVFEAWADRTQVLSALPETRQVYCFENRGEEIGVTLHHPHGQIYAFPFVTPRTERMVAQASEYARTHDGGNLFDDLVAAELRAGPDRDGERALDRVRARGGALAVRGADLPHHPGARPDRRSARPRGTRSGRSTWTSCAGSTRCSAGPRRTSPPGTRPRSGTPTPAASSPRTFRCFRSGARPTS